MNMVDDVTLILYGTARVELGEFVHPATGARVAGLYVHGRCEEIHRSLLRFTPSSDEPFILELNLPVSFVHVREFSEFATSSRGLVTSKFGMLVSGNAKANLGDATFQVLNATVLGNGQLSGIGTVEISTLSANGSAQISGFSILKELNDGCDPTASISVFARSGVRAHSRYTKISVQEEIK